MNNLKTLIIVESPSKGEKIQNYLGKDYIVMSSKGHIADLSKKGSYNLGIDIDNDFKTHYILMDDKIQILDKLILTAKKVDQIFVASDPDREGEAIAWHLYQRLKDVGKPIKRMVFNEIKKDKLLKSVNEVRDIDMDLFHAQEARRILDRIVGFRASPFLMNFFGPNLSAGRVQSVVTKMVIDREREIEDFIPEDFWTIQVILSKDNKESFITKYSGRLLSEKDAKEMYNKLNSSNKYIVSKVISEDEKKGPQAPLVTSSLQRLMSRLYGFASDRTMKAAQSLYESGYCTYIRTDSVRTNDDALQEVRQWLSDNKYSIPNKPNYYKNKDTVQDAHECIRPSDLLLYPNDNTMIIDSDEKLVYEAIWKYFVASQMMPAVYNTLKITAHIENDKSVEVKASGKALKFRGYLDILGVTDNTKIDIPNLKKDDLLNLFGDVPVKMEKKQTQPPPRFSEDKLIKELDIRNIGRPATYAELLNKICTRNYVEKRGSIFHATDLGKKITDVLSKYFTFMDYNYTSMMEKSLDEIESGKINHLDMLNEFYPNFKKELDRAYADNNSILCDQCKNHMVVKISKTTGAKFLACSGFPYCRNTKSVER